MNMDEVEQTLKDERSGGQDWRAHAWGSLAGGAASIL